MRRGTRHRSASLLDQAFWTRLCEGRGSLYRVVTSDWEEGIEKDLCTFQGAAAAFCLPHIARSS